MNRIIYALILPLLLSLNVFAQNGGMATTYNTKPTGLYYGCGVTPDLLETEYYVALNVFDSPRNYNFYPRPITGSNLQYMGEFSNGANCGRWMKVTIGANCKGTNDGAKNQAFCRGAGAAWVDDKYSGSTLYMLVADACADDNAWCRDDPFHLDLFEPSLSVFDKNGVPSVGMYPAAFNNRQITWEYVPAPNYAGDINIYFTVNAHKYYPGIMINNLPNGIHGVEQKVGSSWVKAVQNVDLGQQYQLNNTVLTYTIRIIDADDNLLNNGREYTFTYPEEECGAKCSAPATQVEYTIKNPNVTGLEELEMIPQDAFYTSVEDGLLILHKREKTKTMGGQFTLLDLNGREVTSNEIVFSTNQKAYFLGQIKKGIYVLRVKTGDRVMFSQKIKY